MSNANPNISLCNALLGFTSFIPTYMSQGWQFFGGKLSGEIPVDIERAVEHTQHVYVASPQYQIGNPIVSVQQNTDLAFRLCPVFVADLGKSV